MRIVLALIGLYLVIGVLFGAVFLARGLTVVDPAARGGSRAFRLLILPGLAALWPLMGLKWSRADASRAGGRAA